MRGKTERGGTVDGGDDDGESLTHLWSGNDGAEVERRESIKEISKA